eukprot:TRINITY_DN35982_c0_g1_i1.p1 TRINITY_DN35982_c0_g1~~TRINITY_DN35982_c0_g1_i1.p1  ORF type:complete len:559 (-),score=92.92 TRINITY_DN35982_c0_g1_i1:473-2083(-)
MAPVFSKTKPREESFGHALGEALASHLQQVSHDLCEVAAFIHSCMCDLLDEKVMPHLVVARDAASSLLRSVEQALCQAASRTGSSGAKRGREKRTKDGAKLSDFLPMVVVGQIIGMLYSSLVFLYMPAAGIAFTSPVSIAFHAMVFLLLSSYYMAYSTDPGRVPATPEWQTFEAPPSCLKETKGSGGGARWCRRTHCYKADRAHHCRGLKSVVLRMDHHCPWLCNTVGFANHKFFLQFLLYSSSTCAVTSLSLLRLLLFSPTPLAPSTFLLLMEADAIGIIMSFVLVPFTWFHCWLVASNLTTIEYCEHAFPKPGVKARDPSTYDLGLYRNLSSVLGENLLTWPLPVGCPPGDGLTFERKPYVSKVKLLLEAVEEDLESDQEGCNTADSKRVSFLSDTSTVASWSAALVASPAKNVPNFSDASGLDSKVAFAAKQDPEVAASADEPSPANPMLEAVLSGCASLQDFVQDAACRMVRLCSVQGAAEETMTIAGSSSSGPEAWRSSDDVVRLHLPEDSKTLDSNAVAALGSSLGQAFL